MPPCSGQAHLPALSRAQDPQCKRRCDAHHTAAPVIISQSSPVRPTRVMQTGRCHRKDLNRHEAHEYDSWDTHLWR